MSDIISENGPGNKELESIPVNILVVEDDPDAMFMLKKALSKPNITIIDFTNAEEALVWLRKSKKSGKSADLIISDLGLPRMNGFGLAKIVRDEDLSRRFVLYTGSSMQVNGDNSPEQLSRKGVDKVLEKGIINPIRQEVIATRQIIQASGKSQA